MSALSRTPRSMAEMLIEVTDQRNALARALRDVLAAQTPEEKGAAIACAGVALAKVPSTVLLARKPE